MISPNNERPANTTKSPTKYHHYAVCVVPPETDAQLWRDLSNVRTQLRDPGLYRWPPHINLLYPFLSPYLNDTGIDSDVLEGLQVACRQIEPFTVALARFGTFGGRHRGVLWLHPESEDTFLVKLQQCLQDVFPHCSEQQKFGSFTPHMTLTHTIDLNSALEAKVRMETTWKPHHFVLSEVYLLGREGNAGQFQKIATLTLGAKAHSKTHTPPVPFVHMPTEEIHWVQEERMKLKQRRSGGHRRHQRRRRSRGPRMPDTRAAEHKTKGEAVMQHEIEEE